MLSSVTPTDSPSGAGQVDGGSGTPIASSGLSAAASAERTKYPKGFGRLRVHAERRARYCRALIWLAFRFDLARLDQEAREQSTRDQLATTGGLDPAQFPKPSEIAYLKFSEL